MQTTIDIDEPLLARAERYAAEHGMRLTELVSDALLERLGRMTAATQPQRVPFQMKTFDGGPDGGLMPGIDLSDVRTVYDAELEAFRRPDGTLDLDGIR